VVSSARRRARWSPTEGVARPLRVVLSRWQLQGNLCVVWIRCFHRVGWCVVWQRHYDSGSRMAVAFFGEVRSVSLVSLSVRGRT
jgi:hypothetical protein